MAVLPTGIGPVTGGYQIERSLRFNSADSAYLNRTPASASNRRTWTWSGWVKRGQLGSRDIFFAAGTAGNNFGLEFSANNELDIYQYVSAYQWQLISSSLYRDVSAWYHIVLALDTTQATSTNRVKLYVNGVQVTSFSTSTYPTQNTDYLVNSTSQHNISNVSGASLYMDGYMTEVYLIDGQALTPSSFGETDSNTGVWKPKAYTGTYGTNGFYLKFADNSGTTSTTLGKDSSGNGNNWTPNNFSVTAGAGNDSLVDSPTSYGTDTGVGGEVRGNYVTWNALDRNSSGTLANGNLDWTSGTTAHYGVRGTMSPPSGKWYFEVTAAAATSGTIAYGIGMANAANPLNVGAQSNTGAYLLYGVGTSLELEAAGVQGSTITGASIAANDVIQVAYDVDGSKMWVGKNNTWYNSSGGTTGNPSAGTNPSFSSLLANLFPFVEVYNNTVYANFGQRAFAYTAPSGFKALCTQNLPTPTIGATSTTQANDYFNVVTYTATENVASSITGVGFQPDFVWVKTRADAASHALTDAVRGVQKALFSNTTGAEVTSSTYLTSFDSDGFTQGGAGNFARNSLVAWNWKANGAGSTNTAGTITSTVSANTTSGFSIVTYTGTGANATVGHGLGVAPRMVIVKARNSSPTNWGVYHANSNATPQNYYLLLQSTVAATADSLAWNNTAPTSSVFSLGAGGFNINTATHVAYCFAPVAGYSAFGSYTGNGSADGPMIFTNFRPRYVMVKKTTGTAQHWYVWDSARSTYNLTSNELYPSTSSAETSAATGIDVLSNGFKIRDSSAAYNSNGDTVIYAAFAEHPFKYSLAR
jgi:hypothetical protein